MDWPQQHHLNAVMGWLALGNPTEARTELEHLDASHRALPEALAVEWQLLATEGRWEDAARVADQWVQAEPETPEAWVQRSYALHEQHATREALEQLLPAASRFPGIHTIPYNLACYACQLGQLDTARRWLRRAMLAIKDKSRRAEWVQAAQKDRDLEPLWEELQGGHLG